jgi:hypothetical protein
MFHSLAVDQPWKLGDGADGFDKDVDYRFDEHGSPQEAEDEEDGKGEGTENSMYA